MYTLWTLIKSQMFDLWTQCVLKDLGVIVRWEVRNSRYCIIYSLLNCFVLTACFEFEVLLSVSSLSARLPSSGEAVETVSVNAKPAAPREMVVCRCKLVPGGDTMLAG